MIMKTMVCMLAIALVAAPAWAAAPPPEPWRGYAMDEGSGTTVGPIGSGVTGTVAGGVLSWQPGHTGQAGDSSLRQEGGGYIPLVETYALPGPYSISVWVRHNPGSGGNETIFGADGSTGLLLKDDVGGLYKWTHGSTWDSYAAPGLLDDASWHNVVLTYEPTGNVQHFYIDGVDTDDWMSQYVGGMGSTETRMTLFYSFYGSAIPWGGYGDNLGAYLDDFGVWNSVLTPDQAAWLGNPDNSLKDTIIAPIPEPSGLALLGLGVLALRRRRS